MTRFHSGYIAMVTLLIQFVVATANILVLIFLVYYLLKLNQKEKELDHRESTLQNVQQKAITDAVTTEKKIIDDATKEAQDILQSTQYAAKFSKESLDLALERLMHEVKQELVATAKEHMSQFNTSLKTLDTTSVTDFQQVAKDMEVDLQKQIKEFHEALFPNLKKEMDDYRQAKIQETEQIVIQVVQKVARELLSKTISLDDHHALMLKALEKAKKEGMFE